jgi:hypothetical protein
MQFKTWQEFFKQIGLLDELFGKQLTEEERYQHFKARMIDEGTPEHFIDPDDWVMHVGKNKEV